ncbi:MAG: DEAD/DEAH box helicase [Chitinophagaceae bacterium]|nr:DEAD/DEAH box helicase [Chitinophagaceae bacterium]
MTFHSLHIMPAIQEALEQEGYQHPTPIQAQAIPPALQGNDVLGCAQTGTGKTAAFSIPILQNLALQQPATTTKRGIKALVVTPTRELAIQIDESLAAYGRNLPLRHTVIFGGVSQLAQTQALQRGVDILVATPGRLLDLMQQGFITLQQVQMLVLDEADRMLDMGFIHDVKKILAKVPAKKQTLFFSATMPPEIAALASSLLQNPVRVEVTPVSSTAETIGQQLYHVNRENKKLLLAHLLKDETIKTALVFTRTKHGADKVVKDLLRSGFTAEAIHGNKSQNARQRALSNFKNGTTRVLVATDIAARGIDVDQLSHVINFELPNVPETYVHRIGRTGRAGASGVAISFCDQEEREFLRDIQKLTGISIPVVAENPFPVGVNPTQSFQMPPQRQSEYRGGNRGGDRWGQRPGRSAGNRNQSRRFSAN